MSVIRRGFTAVDRQRGVSLLEVLVAVVVLSIGFVGYAALQMVGVRTNNEAVYRTQAIALAESMVERMYSNRSAREQYNGLSSDNVDCANPPVVCDRGRGDVAPANCDVDQTVAWDAYAVFCGVSGAGGERAGGISKLLPGGSLTVTCDLGCGPTSIYTVQVQWEEFETDGDIQADQDGDGDGEFMTRSVSLQVVP